MSLFQAIGYRLNGDQMCRIAKSVNGKDFTNVLDAYGNVFFLFETSPDYCWKIIPAPPNNPSNEKVNILFVVYSRWGVEPIPIEALRDRPRTQRAKDWLREHGVTEADTMSFHRCYF